MTFIDPDNRTSKLQHTGYAQQSWSYRRVGGVVVRARHLHLDVLMRQDDDANDEKDEKKNEKPDVGSFVWTLLLLLLLLLLFGVHWIMCRV
jgi:hypothetical protein